MTYGIDQEAYGGRLICVCNTAKEGPIQWGTGQSGPKSITHGQSQWTRTTDVISAVEYVLGWVLTITSLGNIGVKLSFERSIENTCAYKYYDWSWLSKLFAHFRKFWE